MQKTQHINEITAYCSKKMKEFFPIKIINRYMY